MLSDAQKLIQYLERVNELNELNKELGEESFESVELAIPGDTRIVVEFANESSGRSVTERFPLKQIQYWSELARKNILYRKKKIAESKK